jgi:hypothetical protein
VRLAYWCYKWTGVEAGGLPSLVICGEATVSRPKRATTKDVISAMGGKLAVLPIQERWTFLCY